MFEWKTSAIKFISCACCVGAGLPVGPEGCVPVVQLTLLLVWCCLTTACSALHPRVLLRAAALGHPRACCDDYARADGRWLWRAGP
jgi:H+/Cl- antiporter ClcA